MITRWDDWKELSLCRNVETVPSVIVGMILKVKHEYLVYVMEENSHWVLVRRSIEQASAKKMLVDSLEHYYCESSKQILST